jgi:hypothetical protein
MHRAMRIECPLCKRVVEDARPDFGPRPFCSERCRLLDLSNWLNETYRFPCEDDEFQPMH